MGETNMLDALNSKDWLEEFRKYSDPASGCTIDELRDAYIQMSMNFMNEIIKTKQLEAFVDEHYGEDQAEKISVEGALSNRLIRILCQNPDDLHAQAESAANFIEYNVLK